MFSYNITYNANGGSSTPSPQTGSTYSNSITLQGSTYRSGYQFLGWCTVNPGSSTSCSGQLYKNGDSFPLNSENNNVTLYATWKRYQNLSGFNCSLLANNESSGAIGTDGNTFSIYKRNGICYAYDVVLPGTIGTHVQYSEASKTCSSYGWRLISSSECSAMHYMSIYSWINSSTICENGVVKSLTSGSNYYRVSCAKN